METKYRITVECSNEELDKKITAQMEEVVMKILNSDVKPITVELSKTEKGFTMKFCDKVADLLLMDIIDGKHLKTKYDLIVIAECDNDEKANEKLFDVIMSKLDDEKIVYSDKSDKNKFKVIIPIEHGLIPQFILKEDK